MAESKPQQTAADSIVLEEEIDPNYVPSEPEVIEYAKWLGMDLENDKDLFWIAREGLMAPLPANWKPCKTQDTEDIYYFNFSTGDSTWDHPCDGYYKRLYEEEKKKKEIGLKENNDSKRAQAKQDIQTLLGKKDKKVKKVKEKIPLADLKAESQLAPVLDRKPLPSLKLSSNLASISTDRKEEAPLTIDVRSSAGSIASSRDSPLLGLSNPLNNEPLPSKTLPKWQSEGKPSIAEKTAEFKQVKPTPETNDNYNSRPSSANVAEHKSEGIESRLNPLSRASPLPDLSHKDEPAQLSPFSDQQTPNTRSQRNFLQHRGLDDESQQKAIAANFKEPILSPKEENRFASNPKEDLRPMVIQLENENSKLLSKLAFNEIELKNCKMELDSMTMTIERNRLNNEELQKCKLELLSKEEEMFSLKSKVRALDVETASLNDQLKSKDVDAQRARLKQQEDLDVEKARTRTFELQFNNLNEMLQLKETEINKLRQASTQNVITATSPTSSSNEQVKKLQDQLQQTRTEMDALQKDVLKYKNEVVAKDEQLVVESTKYANLLADQKKVLDEQQGKVVANSTLLQNKDQEIEHLKSKTKDLEAKLGAQLTAATASATTAEVLLSKQAEVTALETKVKDLEKQQTALTMALDAKGAEITSTLKSKEAEVHNWQSKWKDVEYQLAGLKAESLVWKAKETEMDKLQKQTLEQEEELRALKASVDGKAADANVNLQSKDLEMSQLRERIKALEAQLTSTSSQAMSSSQDLSNLQSMLQSKTLELDVLRQKESSFEQQKIEGDELKLQLSALQATLKGKDLEIEQHKQTLQELESVRSKLRQVEGEATNIAAQLQSKEFEIQQWQAQVNSLKKADVERQQLLLIADRASISSSSSADEEEKRRLQQALAAKEEECVQLHLKTQMQDIEVSKLGEMLKLKDMQINQWAGKDEELQQSAAKIRSLELETLKNRDLLQHKDSELHNVRLRLQEAELEAVKVRALDLQVKSLQDVLIAKEADISKLRVAENSSLLASQSSQLQQQQQFALMELERAKEELRISKAENEGLRKDIFGLKNDHLLKDQAMEGEKSKSRNLELENRKLQDFLQSKDSLSSKVSAKEVECDQLRSQLQASQREAQQLQHQLQQEKELLQQKEKKIKSYQEELLHVQKRLSETAPPLSPMRSGSGKVETATSVSAQSMKVGGSTQTDAITMRDKEVSAKASTKDICVQCNTPRASSTSMMFDAAVQTSDSYPPVLPSNGINSATVPAASSAAKKSATEMNHIKQELSQRKQECQALFDMIQNCEDKVERGSKHAPIAVYAKSNISSIPKKTKASAKYYSSPSPDFDDVDFHATSSGMDSVEDHREHMHPRTPATEWKDSPMTDTNKDLLQSLSEIQNTPMPGSLAVDSSASDMLVYVANLFTKINNAIYALKLHNLSTSRRLVQLTDSNSSDLDLKKSLLSQRLDEESGFVKMLQQSLAEGKSFIESGRKQIERLKRQYEDASKSSKSSAMLSKKNKEANKEMINNHTNDMNVIIRLVRTLQQCGDTRNRLVKDVKRDIMGIVRSKKVHSSRLDSMDKELVKLQEEINDIVKPLLHDGRAREKASRSPLKNISPIQETESRDIRVSYPAAPQQAPMQHPAYYQQPYPMYAFPPGMPAPGPPIIPMQAFIDPAMPAAAKPMMAMPSTDSAELSSRLTVPNGTLLSSQTQGLRSQLDHVQRQISYTQNKQMDSLKEYDRHFSWLGTLMKDLDQRPFVQGSKQSSATFSNNLLGSVDDNILPPSTFNKEQFFI